MIHHIVMWRLRKTALGNGKAVNARLIRDKLHALRGRIPGLLHLEVGIDDSSTEHSADVVLSSRFESRAALDTYQRHPDHQAVVAFVKQVVTERRVVDHESP